MIRASASSDDVKFFSDSVESKDSSESPQKVLEVQGTGGDGVDLVEVVLEGDVCSFLGLVGVPTMVLEMS
jgi:hypothetical protein